jgi:hypothetical protein
MARKKTTDQPKTGKSNGTKVVKQIPSPIPGPSNTMNTITFSTDMDTLYLIDSGRAIPYSLNTIGGILVGVIKGQLVVVSALEPMPDKDDNTEIFAFQERGIPIPNVKAAKIATERGQWTITYIRKSQKICIMGAVDIEVGLQESDNLEVLAYLFDLREGFINIQKIGSTIIVETIATTI